MKLVKLAVVALTTVAIADRASFEANKAEQRTAILAQKQKAWAVKEAQRVAKNEENIAARESKDEAKANSWAIKQKIRNMKDLSNAIIRKRKDAAKANSWKIRQVVRDRKDAAKAVVDYNRDSAKAVQAAVSLSFFLSLNSSTQVEHKPNPKKSNSCQNIGKNGKWTNWKQTNFNRYIKINGENITVTNTLDKRYPVTSDLKKQNLDSLPNYGLLNYWHPFLQGVQKF